MNNQKVAKEIVAAARDWNYGVDVNLMNNEKTSDVVPVRDIISDIESIFA